MTRLCSTPRSCAAAAWMAWMLCRRSPGRRVAARAGGEQEAHNTKGLHACDPRVRATARGLCANPAASCRTSLKDRISKSAPGLGVACGGKGRA